MLAKKKNTNLMFCKLQERKTKLWSQKLNVAKFINKKPQFFKTFSENSHNLPSTKNFIITLSFSQILTFLLTLFFSQVQTNVSIKCVELIVCTVYHLRLGCLREFTEHKHFLKSILKYCLLLMKQETSYKAQWV